MPSNRPVQRTEHGFQWNGNRVEVAITDDKYGMAVVITGARGQSFGVRITPRGKIVADRPRKRQRDQ